MRDFEGRECLKNRHILTSQNRPHPSSMVPSRYHSPSMPGRSLFWGFSECPGHSGVGVMSTSLRWLKSSGGQGWKGLHRCNELKEFELHKLNGFNGLHRLHEVDGGRESRRLRGLEGVDRV